MRIATFNLENLGEGTGLPGLDERVAILRPQVLRMRADVLCLQEINAQRGRTGKPRVLKALDRLLEGTPYAGFHRVTTLSPSGPSTGPRDRHNLVILSRYAIDAHRQVRHDFVDPPRYRPVTSEPAASRDEPIEWDRPILHATLQLDGARRLNLINVHLRAPRAARVEGQKSGPETWRTMAGWSEGFFMAAVKRAGQALEVRLLIESIFESHADALIAVCGDFNADEHEVPLRIVQGSEGDAGNPRLARRVLVALERSIGEGRRFSVIHHGRRQMVDHLLVSQPLVGWFRGAEVHNESLGDELVVPARVPGAPESFHAPLVCEFMPPEPIDAGRR